MTAKDFFPSVLACEKSLYPLMPVSTEPCGINGMMKIPPLRLN